MKNRRTWNLMISLIALLTAQMVPLPVSAAPAVQSGGTGEADALNQQGIALFNQGKYQDAIGRFEAALNIYKQLDDQQDQVIMLKSIGRCFDSLGNYEQAMDNYQQALALAEKIDDQAEQGELLYSMGSIYYILGQYSQAINTYDSALKIVREIGDRQIEMFALSDLGVVYSGMGQFEQALEYYKQALDVAQELGDQNKKGTILNNIAVVYMNLGRNTDALEQLQQSLAISQELGDRIGEAPILGNMGTVSENLGKYEQALKYHQQALSLYREASDRLGEATALVNIAKIYLDLAQYSPALEYLQEAIVLLRQNGDAQGLGRALNNMGGIYRHLQQYDQALDYYQQSLEISQKIGDRASEETTLSNIGLVLQIQGQLADAMDHYQQSLRITREIGDRAGEGRTLNNIGFIYDAQGQFSKALDFYEQSLSVLQTINEQPWQASVLNNTGFVYEQLGDFDKAVQSYERAIAIIESIQGSIKVDELKTSFLADQSGFYDGLIHLLSQEGRYEEAFNYVERSRSRTFLDQLARGSLNIRSSADAKYLEREQTLKTQIMALHDQLTMLQSKPQNQIDTDVIARAQAQLAKTEADYAQLLTEIKLQSPEVASLVSVDVNSLANIQKLLDSNTTLLEYFVMEDRTLAFVISRNSFETATININREDLIKTIDEFRDFVSLEDTHPESLKKLYAWLIEPIQGKLKTSTLGIIPHGPLHYLPFAALTNGREYLVDEYSLFTLPSASSLRFIQEKRKPAANTLLALGNPATSEPGLSPLNFAKQEVTTISNLYGSKPLIGTQATETALRTQVGDAAILHLAAHGEYNVENPLFSAIYLTADSQEDGRLEVNEIYGLDLTKNTDLVVLSACQTNLGSISAGDEIVGLNRAFLYAGTPTVISSLWNVDDAATALLMERFYTHLRQGMSKAEALRTAQKEVRETYPQPYYWAAFVLTGDTGETISPDSRLPAGIRNRLPWLVGIGGAFLLGLGCLSLVTFLAVGLLWRSRRRRAK